jgi:hypothetical protein
MRGKLPAWLRWEWDGERSIVNFRCQCSLEESQSYHASVEDAGSAMSVRCRNCRMVFQLRASQEYPSEGGAPGSAKRGG